MARHFGYYDENWKTEILTCPLCGWTGTFEEGGVEHYKDLMDSSCPSKDCPDNPILAIIPYPTAEETERHNSLLIEQPEETTL